MTAYLGRQLDHDACVDVGGISAHFSCGLPPDFRYALLLPFRRGAGGGQTARRVAVILKNPSAADTMRADATVRRVEGYVHRHFSNASELVILNLFAYRATRTCDVKERMERGDEVVGPRNDHYTRHYCAWATDIILGWGRNSKIPMAQYRLRIDAVCRTLAGHRDKLWCVPPLSGQGRRYPRHGQVWNCSKPPVRADLAQVWHRP